MRDLLDKDFFIIVESENRVEYFKEVFKVFCLQIWDRYETIYSWMGTSMSKNVVTQDLYEFEIFEPEQTLDLQLFPLVGSWTVNEHLGTFL